MNTTIARTRVRRGRNIALLLACTAPVLFAGGCAKAGISPKAEETNGLFWTIFLLAVPVFALFEGALLTAVVRFRRRRGDDTEAPQIPGGKVSMSVIFAIPLVIVSVLLYYGEVVLSDVDHTSDNPDLHLVVTGFQWEWSANYVDQGFTVTGKTNKSRLVMEVPVNDVVQVELRSTDVIHEFYVPDLLFMKNAVPGHPNVFSFQPTKLGTFHGQCAQFCGLDHSTMQFDLKVVSAAEFQSWVEDASKPAPVDTSTCPAPSSAVTLVAEHISWDQNCLGVAAGKDFTVTIDNRDTGIAHNFAIYTASDLKHRLFLSSPNISGPAKATYTVPALPAGTYYFQCDIHGPAMAGTLVVS
jgi:cytochrome c oxidase subunit 2